MCIGGTPYVYSHIILLPTPTITGVTKIAHRERVPNGALPKLGRVLTPLWGRTIPSSKKRRLRWRCASLFHHHDNMLLPWVVLVWQTLYRKELLAKQDIVAHWYYWTRLLTSSFAVLWVSRSCVHRHIYCSHHRVLAHIYVVRQWNCYPPVNTCSSMVFVLGHIWNNGRQQQHLIVAVTLRDWLCLSRYRFSLVDVTLHQVTLQGWMPHLCSWNHSVYMNTYGYRCSQTASLFLKTHCAWTHIIWTWLLSKMSWRHSMCLAAYHNCSWSCHSSAVDHTYVLQLHDVIGHITLEECFNLKHCHFIKWHHWCHRPKQCSSFVIDFMEQDYWTRLLAKFIVIFYI